MASEKPVRAAIYCRISKDKTGQRAGVDRQQRECRQLAERVTWPVVRVYVDDDISAYSGKRRPEYEALLSDIGTGEINAVIAWHPDRLHRRPIELEHYIDVCDKHSVANQTVQTGLWDLSTPSGRLMARQLGAVARYESEHKSERVRSAHLDIAEQGGWHGGVRCFGYEPDGMTIRQSEADEIERLAKAVIEGKSLRSLALELNDRGVPTVKGKRWSSSHLGRMLVRSRLAGLREHKGKILGDAKWPAIIDSDTLDSVRAVLKDPDRCTGANGRRGPTPTALGTAIYVCGVCGEPRMRRGSSHTRRPVYQCGAASLTSSLGHVSRVAEPLDAYVEGALLKKLSEPGVIEAMCNVVDTNDHDITALQHEQKDIRKELKQLAAQCDAGDLDIETLAIASRSRRQRDKEITGILTAAQKRSPLHVLLGAESIEQMWDDVLTMGQKRAILAEMLVVTVNPTTSGGRAPDGTYFNTGAIHIDLTEQARGRTLHLNNTERTHHD
jgi:site-specific DNA recombinase